MSVADWEAVMRVHLRGAFLMSRAAQKCNERRMVSRPDSRPTQGKLPL
jgi:NAD(P)-dependent dehydrogenase (short-subunit alcohol dehydrogenase family)